jgi:RNA polymerase sigma-70 factor (ECF subfamily)
MQALILAYFGGLSQSAIAEKLGWPLGTVKKRIRLGMQKLRQALAPQAILVELRDETTNVE